MNYSFLRKLLFHLDPEAAHEAAICALKLLQKINLPKVKQDDERLHSEYWGLSFKNPIGIAAGFDKNAAVYPALAGLGFGFVEVGTLTPEPQIGNSKPRLFRLPTDEALINRMGFNNHGLSYARENFMKLRHPLIPVGINLGKNKDTPNEQATEDYCNGLRTLYPFADYFVINISSPNTVGLRDLQEVESLYKFLKPLLPLGKQLSEEHGKKCPILLKLSPDLDVEHVKEITHAILYLGIDGVIVTNTSLSREGLNTSTAENGGLSGRPLREISTSFIRTIYEITQGQIPIIGVGGVFTGKDAYEKIRAGANLVQIYTGFIYRGPAIVQRITEELLTLMNLDGIHSITDAVGYRR